MEKIKSFSVDHTRLVKGVYVSRIDEIGKESVTTFDLRMKTPYKDEPLSPLAIHTLEHLGATWLRNSERKDEVLYFGPMGCQTGFYLIMKGKLKPVDIEWMLKRMFRWITKFTGDIPGATEKECGNCYLNDLEGAKMEAALYLNGTLSSLDNYNTNYK